MVSNIHNITFDTTGDPYELATFWSAVTGRPMHDDDVPGDPEAVLIAEGQPALLFVRVPEGRVVKNRVHLDLQPGDRTRDEEVDRLIGAGATLVEDHRRPDGTGWVTLADPEGNEFCVERSAAERAAG
ncbi:VOC family protein [Pseudosporangium ferrugineum]|uniref:Putative enzyme related to lactoylglutathione lyase n=1 Tax=Pseudosporangium ferrugineum TaxID=439699 RepID=A0A2T0RH97_9ACTN|nr:VOC family protein [Pseudosporangium ferrugineum]PRY20545.1 putative enzyme related to lactoylglutathione lyase [Pseudosporangium ferrugineum]